MKNEKEVLCEIRFNDHKSGVLTSRIGRIDESQFNLFSTNSKNFIIFKERYNSPILKSDIKEIIIYRENKKISINNENSSITKHIKSKDKGKIS